jgi:hypothetical protein
MKISSAVRGGSKGASQAFLKRVGRVGKVVLNFSGRRKSDAWTVYSE